MGLPTGISIQELPADAAAALGANRKITIDHRFFASVEATSKAVYPLPYHASGSETFGAGTMLAFALFDLETAFDGGATSDLLIKIGDASTSDSLLADTQIHADDTEVPIAVQPFATKSSQVYVAANKLVLTFTEAAQNLNLLTAGKIHIYIKYVDVTQFRKVGKVNN